MGPLLSTNMINKITFKENRLIFKSNLEAGVREPAVPQKTPETENLKDKLTPQEYADFKGEKITRQELANQKREADEQTKKILAKADKENIFDKKTIAKYLNQIDENISPAKAQKLKEEIEAALKNSKTKEDKENEVLDINSPEIELFHNKFHGLLDKNLHLIGTKQKHEYDKWFHEELEKQCTVKNAKDLIRRFEGIDSTDQGGLFPRRQNYNELKELYTKFGLQSPEIESEYVRTEGLSERKAFLKNAKEQEYQLRTSNPIFYSKKSKEGIMKDILKSKNPTEQQEQIQIQKRAAINESAGFIAFNSQTKIAGMSFQTVSDASQRVILGFYQDTTSLKDREMFSSHWPKAAEAEGNLYHELAKIYKNDSEGLKKALTTFSILDFQEKQKSLKENEKDLHTKEGQEKLEKSLLIKAAHTKIDEAAHKKILSKSSQEKYKVWFSDPSNHRDPATRKPGSTEQLEVHFKKLTSNTPDEKAKNLKAYEEKRNNFKDLVSKLKEANPNISDHELQQWQDKFDQAGWHERGNLEEEIKQEIKASKKVQSETKEAKNALNITKPESSESREISPEMKDLLVLLAQCEAEDTYESIHEGYLAIFNFKLQMIQENGPSYQFSTVFLHNEAKFATLLKNKQTNATTPKETTIEDSVDRKLDDEKTNKELEQVAIEEINEEQTRVNANSNGEKSAHERSEEEAKSETVQGSEEREITEAFYQMDRENHDNQSNHIEDGKATKMDEIILNNSEMNANNLFKQKHAIKEHSTDINKNEGFNHIIIKDEKGKEINSNSERKAKIENRSEEKLNKIAEEAMKEQSVREAAKGNSFNETANLIAAKRALEQQKEEAKRKIPQAS